MPAIPTLERWRQEDYKLEIIIRYIMSSRPFYTT